MAIQPILDEILDMSSAVKFHIHTMYRKKSQYIACHSIIVLYFIAFFYDYSFILYENTINLEELVWRCSRYWTRFLISQMP